MAKVTIQSFYIPNFTLAKVVGASVTLRWELNGDGIDATGAPRVKGWGPEIVGTVYKWDAGSARFEDDLGAPLPHAFPELTVEDGPYLLFCAAFEIEPTSRFVRPAGLGYTPFFVYNSKRTIWRDLADSRIDADASTQSIADISLYNKSVGPGLPIPYTYTREEIDFKILHGSLANPMTALGDLIYGGAVVDGAATPVRLPLSNGFLKRVGSAPAWTDIATSDIPTFDADVDARITSLAITTALGYVPSAPGHVHVPGDITGFDAEVDSRITNAAVLTALGSTSMLTLATLVTGGFQGGVQSIVGTGTVPVAPTAFFVKMATGGVGTLNVTLPPAATYPGRLLVIARADFGLNPAHIYNLNADGADTISRGGSTVSSIVLGAGGDCLILVSDGAARWFGVFGN